MDIRGTTDPRFARVRNAFADNFARHGEIGAACCVYVDGRAVVDLQGGSTRPDGGESYGPRTLQLVASATKGAMAICAHRLVQRGELDLDAPVARYWPEFATAGKDRIPVRWLLSHQAGLPAIDGPVTLNDIVDWDPVVAKVAASAPVWEPGTEHGYHAITYGWLVGEVLRRITGSMPATVLADEITTALGLDLHIGLPEPEQVRLSPLHPVAPPPPGAPPDPLSALLADPDSLAHRAYLVDEGLLGWFNDPRLIAAQLPAGNGTSTAHALARMYAACIGEVDGVRLLEPATLASARLQQAAGDDLVQRYETAYALGFQLAVPYRPMAGPGSFGHYGLGGSVGFADTDHGFAFGYTVNQMGRGVPADPRSVALVDAVLACL